MYMLSSIDNIIYVYLAVCLVCLVYNWWIQREGADGISYLQCVNPVKQLSILVGFVFYFLIPRHVFEQFVLRLYDPYCRPNCLLGNGGKCISCGCNTAAKMFSPLEKDSKDNWGYIIWSKDKYTELRTKYPVEIRVEYGKIQS